MSEQLTLVSPWVNFYKEIEALFGRDPEIRVEIDDVDKKVTLYVSNGDKAEALSILLPDTKTFGNIEVRIEVINENDPDNWDLLKNYEMAFKGNPAFDSVKESVTPFGTFRYVIFARVVVQYRNDDIGDANQIRSTLCQEIAKDIFEETGGIRFCTENNFLF